MKSLIKFNIIIFLAYITFAILIPTDWNVFFIIRFSRSLLELLAIFVLGGLNLSALFQLLFKKNLTFWENISVSLIFSISIVPLLLSLEYSQIKIINPFVPFLNSCLLFLFIVIVYTYNKKSLEYYTKNFFLEIKKVFTNYSYYHPLYLSFFIYSFIIFSIAIAYASLPDLDPYYWMGLFGKQFKTGEITSLFSSRPLFSSLTYIFNQSSHVDLYAYFKYIIPILYIIVLLPAWMIAEKFDSRIKRFLILLLPLTSASTILYSQTTMPQVLVIIFSYYFFFFIVYSWITKNNTFYYLAGAIIFLAYFYQELAAIMLFPWIAISIFRKRTAMKKWALENKLSLILIIAVIISYSKFLIKPFEFIYSWTKIIFTVSKIKLNFFFPSVYNNIDGNAMGWGGPLGIAKYYIYYVGIGLILVFLFLIYLTQKSESFRSFVKGEMRKKEIQIIILCFIIFFSISEIFTRFPGIALLPERSWIFGGIFSLIFAIFILIFLKNKYKIVCYVLILAFSTNAAGAIYINGLKKYVITIGQLQSAEWIKANLSEKRTFFSNGNRNLIGFHSGSEIQTVSDDFYYNINSYLAKIKEYYESTADKNEKYKSYISAEKNNVAILEKTNIFSNKESVLEILNKISNETDNIKKAIGEDAKQSKDKQNLYIYYAKENEKNPYLNRPYYENKNSNKKFIFDQYPEKFQRIYYDKENKIIIWKIL